MKKLIVLAIPFLSLNAFAEAQFSCYLQTNPEVKVVGKLTTDNVTVKITDTKNALGVRELTPDRVVEMSRNLRKKEDKYSFAKYYTDFNAWQDLEISVPKKLNSAKFRAYLTVYMDIGEHYMAPGESNILNCQVGTSN